MFLIRPLRFLPNGGTCKKRGVRRRARRSKSAATVTCHGTGFLSAGFTLDLSSKMHPPLAAFGIALRVAVSVAGLLRWRLVFVQGQICLLADRLECRPFASVNALVPCVLLLFDELKAFDEGLINSRFYNLVARGTGADMMDETKDDRK